MSNSSSSIIHRTSDPAQTEIPLNWTYVEESDEQEQMIDDQKQMTKKKILYPPKNHEGGHGFFS